MRNLLGSLVPGLCLLAVPSADALAHVVCGDRVFPATLVMDDPGVGDELSLPTIQYTPIPATAGNPSGQITDYGFEWDKTITPNFGFALNGDYLTQHGAGQNLQGWDNVTVTLKYELPCQEADELAFSFGVVREFAGTGSSRLISAGAINSVSNTAPTLYVGKGLGDLPIGDLRAFAVTGELGYAFSDAPRASPDQVNYAVSLQYSLPYFNQHIRALEVPEFLTRVIPLVEVSFSTPIQGPTTGIVAPGFLYEGNTWQAGVEALIPANAATRQSQGVGFIVQFHLFLDDIFPNSLGKPLFN